MTWRLGPNRIRVVELVSRRVAARQSSVLTHHVFGNAVWGTLDAALLSRQENLPMVEALGLTFEAFESS